MDKELLCVPFKVDAVCSHHNYQEQHVKSAARKRPFEYDPPQGRARKTIHCDTFGPNWVALQDRANNNVNVDVLIELHELKEISRNDPRFFGVRKFVGGQSDDLFELFVGNNRYGAIKLYKAGVSHDMVKFHLVVKSVLDKAVDDLKFTAREQAAFETIVSAAVPIAWIRHLDQKCLVFRWVDAVERELPTEDKALLRDQIDVCHKLGFCHLDITQRNIVLTKIGPVLVDYDCVCAVDKAPLGPLANENDPDFVLKRPNAEFKYDEYLWEKLVPLFPMEASIPAPAVVAPAAVLYQGSDSSAPPRSNAIVSGRTLLQLARALREKGQHEASVQLLCDASEQGLAEAEYLLGVCYDEGTGVAEDKKLAVKWFLKAADQGYADAQNRLGDCYFYGSGVAEDEKAAVDWHRKSADIGLAAAQFNLGVCYDEGSGVAKDEEVAVEWYRQAAEQGHAGAQWNLGVCYEDGTGVAKDEKLAVQWYCKAAEQGDANAQNSLGNCYDNGIGVAKDEKVAVEWYRKAADQGHTGAQFNLGLRYANGSGVAKDEKLAVEWFRRSAQQGNATAQSWLGWCYDNGVGVAKDGRLAAEWYRKAAEHGNAALKTLWECATRMVLE